MVKPEKIVYENGLRALLIPMKDQRTATIMVLVEAGSKYETKDKNGISHFLEHMCFKGTNARPEPLIISSELDGLGAEYNAFTMHEVTGYHAKVAAEHLPQALDLIADLYLDPLFKADDIEREKGVIVGEIDMRNDMLPRRAGELFMELLYGDQPAGWPIAGPKELIRTFARDDFLAYRNAHYVAPATVVIVAGKFSPGKVKHMIGKKFFTIRSGRKGKKEKVCDTQSKPAIRVEYKDCDQTHLVLGFRSYPLSHRSYPALNVIGSVLGGGMSSRLFRKIRDEMGAGYYAHAGNDSYTDHGMIVAAAGVEHGKTEAVIRAIVEEFDRLQHELVPADELKRVKDMLSGRLALGLEASDELAEFYGFQEALRGKYLTPEETIARMQKVTAKELRELARTLFRKEHLNLALIGPWKSDDPFRKALRI